MTSSRFAWPPRPVLLFATVLAVFAAVGLAGLWLRPPRPTGLPDDPAVEMARRLIGAGLPIAAEPLRFESELLGAAPSSARSYDAVAARPRLTAAERALEQARLRRGRDPRVLVALAHLDLARAKLEQAERRYREVLDLSPRYGEARLGLGVALALEASAAWADEPRARRLRLEAIAQLAAVEPDDPCYRPALYDRALLLKHVGRAEEARRWAARYLASEPGSEWSRRLARMLVMPAQ